MDWVEFTGKNVDDALTEALIAMEATSDKVDWEVIEKESKGVLGLFSRPARIRVKMKQEEKAEVAAEKPQVKEEINVASAVFDFNADGASIIEAAKAFLTKVLSEMHISAEIKVELKDGNQLDIDIVGEDMGVLIGKRGQTLDSLQYLTSLVVNKESSVYVKVKLDTENYRERRKETLENLAKNIAYKVKRSKHSVSLEPMNPYERRIIHSALQYDKFVDTHSEGEEPYRRVVVTLKNNNRDHNRHYNRNYHNNSNSGYKKNYKPEHKNSNI
ncbi:RNA-binding cell elongation regulator Jag/EloR [[Clostridium] polysaccharolyticum]|jgi:spoIIIJ-associated protein|uniref:RNA-binding protein KhpB n=1 Tax=[Clostridium] polysaccharolyticum TaxID=29364 RepID=A0A1I0F3I1_9FIRM|nr:RNA-binding cell elongation regulator Jag/EloR [[Clostridium] polysaccharolyticum]SET51785.1 spoIIIJ-associated protein [[Clostridium] polysaccharolyticum]